MALNGNNIFISLDGSTTPFAATKSNDIHTECGIQEISGPESGDWEDCIASRKRWSFNVSFLVGNPDDIANMLMIGNTYNIAIVSRDGSTYHKITGRAICQSCKITATRGNLTAGTFSFRGKGELAKIPITGITLSDTTKTIRVNQSGNKLTATISPADATVQKLLWTSSSAGLVVDQSGGFRGVAPGHYTITCSATDGSNVSATCAVTVTQ